MNLNPPQLFPLWKPVLVTGSVVFMYWTVLLKLGFDWWNDDNYSHGLLVPFVIAYIVWDKFDELRSAGTEPARGLGILLTAAAAFMLLAGSLASVLFAQRISLVIMLAGVVIYFFGTPILKRLLVPFGLLLLANPIPQILFNKIAFPLQLLASRIAARGIEFFGIQAERSGNIIGIPHLGTGEIISLEVVEACSGIRSLMTLVTLALILGYFTRESDKPRRPGIRRLLSDRDLHRTLLLMTAAVPIAILTNAARVAVTGLIAYFYGYDGVEGVWHDISGSFVFLSALLLLFGANLLLKRVFDDGLDGPVVIRSSPPLAERAAAIAPQRVVVFSIAIILCGSLVNWFQYRGEAHVQRRPLAEIPQMLGSWEQRNEDIRFDPETEKVLRATDYVMRDYYGPGKRLNLYVGYYGSQRSGATYHSPLSCLPGTGWELSDPRLLEISTPGGKRFTANRYIVRQGQHKEYLIYWYQGRGRISHSEYVDKFYTSLDSIIRRRSDGGMVRIMTPLGKDPDHSFAAAVDLTGHVADNIEDFLPN